MTKLNLNRATTLTAFAALTALGAQGCAVDGEFSPPDCESLTGSAVQQLEVEMEQFDALVSNHLQLCVTADNYDACETLEQIDHSNTYATTYANGIKNVASIYLRVAPEDASLESQVSHITIEHDGRGITYSRASDYRQVDPVTSALGLPEVAVVAITDDGRELEFAVAPDSGRNLEFTVAADGASELELASCPQ